MVWTQSYDDAERRQMYDTGMKDTLGRPLFRFLPFQFVKIDGIDYIETMFEPTDENHTGLNGNSFSRITHLQQAEMDGPYSYNPKDEIVFEKHFGL